MHSVVKEALYSDWSHPEKAFIPLKHFLQQYYMEEEFYEKWEVSSVDPCITCFSLFLTVPLDDFPFFKDTEDKKFESLFKVSCALVGRAMPPVVASMEMWESLVIWSNCMACDPSSIFMDPSVLQQLEFFPNFCLTVFH